jgi:cobalt-zinc-cadmium efflux system membrane fusion protein
MKRTLFISSGLVFAGGLLLAGCRGVQGQSPSSDGGPPLARVTPESDGNIVPVEHPERFPLATAGERKAPSELTVTGVVSPDVSRAVPAISLASGRVVEIRARLGDQVQKGQILMRVQSTDISGAFSDYRKAVVDETLARTQLERAKALFDKGAIAQKDLDVAQDTEDKAIVDVETTRERLRVLGVSPDQPPNAIVDVIAPVSGTITEQNVTNAGGVKTLDNSPNLFTISDLSEVWVVCDVYENDLATLHLGDGAEIHLAAYPDHVLTGRISNILPVLDPTIRTAKVRIEVRNPGLLRLGMFVTAIFRGQRMENRTVVPAAAIVHLHDRTFVFVPTASSGRFQRVEVVAGNMLPGNQQEVLSGIQPGARVIANGLVFANTVEQ